MSVRPDDEITFDEGDGSSRVAAVIAELVAPGSGWLNLLPEVEPELEPPPRGVMAAIFSARGPVVPMATVTAPEAEGRPISVGIEHGGGPKALTTLDENELPLPPGWRKLADHPRRGLVLAVPTSTPAHELLDWVLAAAHILSPIPLTGSWLARTYRSQ